VRRIGLGRGVVVVACALTVLAGGQAGSGETPPPAAVRTGPASGVVAPVSLRIMPLGASSTFGAGSAATAGYRAPLQQLLARDGITVDFVGSLRDGPPSMPDRDHEGRGGWTLARMAPFVTGWVRQARPDVVLLHAGTNDLLQGVTADVAAARLDTVLDAIHVASGAHVVVAGVWAPLPTRAHAREVFAVLAEAVVEEHRAQGHSVGYADTSALLETGDFSDGLHANGTGYRRIAAMWERQILAHLAG
jgi:acyl-CoA thioesterase-1